VGQEELISAESRSQQASVITMNTSTSVPNLKSSERTNHLSQKTCPNCAERIQLEALICRYCGHQFSEVEIMTARQDFQAQAEREKADATIRDQQKIALLRLRNFHGDIAKQKKKANAWLLPLLIGFGIGCGACWFISLPIAYLINPNVFTENTTDASPVPGCVGMVVFLCAWILTTFLLRRRAKQQSAGLISKAEVTLKTAVDEIAQLYPSWVKEIGGTSSLSDSRSVEMLITKTGADLKPSPTTPVQQPPPPIVIAPTVSAPQLSEKKKETGKRSFMDLTLVEMNELDACCRTKHLFNLIATHVGMTDPYKIVGTHCLTCDRSYWTLLNKNQGSAYDAFNNSEFMTCSENQLKDYLNRLLPGIKQTLSIKGDLPIEIFTVEKEADTQSKPDVETKKSSRYDPSKTLEQNITDSIKSFADLNEDEIHELNVCGCMKYHLESVVENFKMVEGKQYLVEVVGTNCPYCGSSHCSWMEKNDQSIDAMVKTRTMKQGMLMLERISIPSVVKVYIEAGIPKDKILVKINKFTKANATDPSLSPKTQ
jgi:hypothetical protein